MGKRLRTTRRRHDRSARNTLLYPAGASSGEGLPFGPLFALYRGDQLEHVFHGRLGQDAVPQIEDVPGTSGGLC